MPLVLMCGYPCSGKTTRAKELFTFLKNQKNVTTEIIGDSELDIDRNRVYSDSKIEKELRGNLKSATQRKINKDAVIILDSPNYIKGFRYELFCVTKSAQTPQCVIHCDISQSQASEWNSARSGSNQYSQEIFDGLVMRFEPPESKNRWDSPLFLLHPEDELPCEDIYNALFLRKAPPPNMSTLSQPLSSTNFLHELDKISQEIVAAVVSAQKTGVPGDLVTVPGTPDKVAFVRPLTLAELQRIRRQFISFTKTHPTDDTSKIANMFVQFLNNSIK